AGPNVGNVGPTVAPVSIVDTSTTMRFGRESEESNGENVVENRNPSQNSKLIPLETRAMAWDEAERAKYMARFKQEEYFITILRSLYSQVIISLQIYNQEPSRSATPVRATTPAARSPIASGSTTPVRAGLNVQADEAKAERLKSRAQEKYKNKLASTRRIAEEKRAKAEATMNEKAVKTCERADSIMRTGHLPSSFSVKLPSCSCCWVEPGLAGLNLGLAGLNPALEGSNPVLQGSNPGLAGSNSGLAGSNPGLDGQS
ncbi:remorin, partial [Tanacetum coccineum]